MSKNGNGNGNDIERRRLKEKLQGFVTGNPTTNTTKVEEDVLETHTPTGGKVTFIFPNGHTNGKRGEKQAGSQHVTDIVEVAKWAKTNLPAKENTLKTTEQETQLFVSKAFESNLNDFSLKNILNEKEAEKQTLKNEVEDLKRQLDVLKAKISGLENASTKISPTLTPRTTGEVMERSQDYWELELKLSELKEELQVKESMLSELEESFAGKDTKILQLTQQKDSLNVEIQRIGEEIFQFEATRKNKEDEYARVNMSLTEKVRKLEIEVKEIDSFRKQLAVLEELRLAMFNSQSKYLSEMTDKNDELVGKNRRLSTELDQEKNFLAQARAKIDELLAELKVMNKANSDLRGETQNEKIKREESISWSEYELLKIQEVLSWSEYNYGQKENALKSFDQILKLKQEELRGKVGNIAAQKRIINSLKSELETIKTQLDSEKKQAASFQDLSTQLRSQVDELNQSLVQAQKRHDDVVAGLASTFRSAEERQRLEKEDLSKRNEELDAKLNFIRQRTKDLVARTKESRAEKKQRLENERLIQEQSEKERSFHNEAVKRWKDERIRAEKEELDKKRKGEFREKIANAKSGSELFVLATEFLKPDADEAKNLNNSICDYLYKNDPLKNKLLAEIGFNDKLFLVRSEYLKGLEEATKANSWIETHKYFVENIEPKMLKYSDDKETSLRNGLNEVVPEIKKYIPENLFAEFERLKKEDVEKGKLVATGKDLEIFLGTSEYLKEIKNKRLRRDFEGFAEVIVNKFGPEIVQRGKTIISMHGKEFDLENTKGLEKFAKELYYV